MRAFLDRAKHFFPLRHEKTFWFLTGMCALGFLLRVIGIADGLPGVFNADEPHFMNTAVYFGSGTLNPPLFKYPTLWMYSLFGSLGMLFALWSGFGLWHGVRDFGVLFVSDPTLFYITGRLLSCFISVAAALVVYKMARVLWSRNTAAWAAALAVLLPSAIDAAHYAKWESLLLLTCAGAWYFALRVYRDGAPKYYVLCGLMLGLSVSTHYIAWLLCALLPAAHIARVMRGGPTLRALAFHPPFWLGCAAIPIGFLIGTPFAALDFAKFRASIADVADYTATRRTLPGRSGLPSLGTASWNIMWFGGAWSPAFLLAAAALTGIALSAPWLAFLLAVPVLCYFVFLSLQPDGGFMRYTFTFVPALCILAAHGAQLLAERFRFRAIYALALLLIPAVTGSALGVSQHITPDTRTVAARWIEAHLPPDSGILIDQLHASPTIHMSAEQAREMLAKTEAARNPRARYYAYLAQAKPKIGYRLYQIERSNDDLAVLKGQLALVKEGQPLFNVNEGLGGLKARGISYVAVSSFGVDPKIDPVTEAFFKELSATATRMAEFMPRAGALKGPVITIYKVD